MHKTIHMIRHVTDVKANIKVYGCKLLFPVMSSLVSTADILEITFYFSSRTEPCVAQKTVTSQSDANTE